MKPIKLFAILLIISGIILIIPFAAFTGNVTGINTETRVVGLVGLVLVIAGAILENYEDKKIKSKK